MAVSAAGPLSDLTLGAIFAIGALSVAAGTLRDVLIQLAVAAYVIALLSLDPLHDRDGYRLLVDGLREPDLRRRATEQLSRRLSGLGPQLDRPVLGRYALFVIAWAIVVNLVLLLPGRYEAILEMLVPMGVVWAERALRAALWFAFFGPVLFVIARSLLARARPAKPAF
jgi:putative peptide zinc metalloprotease protein